MATHKIYQKVLDDLKFLELKMEEGYLLMFTFKWF
jgi:hypothetical protein